MPGNKIKPIGMALFLVILIVFILIWLICGTEKNNMEQKLISINNIKISIETAVNALEQANGLSGRRELCQNCAMYFAYDDYKIRNFWMNKMNFPIDILWLKDGEVVGFQENIQPFADNGEIGRMKSSGQVNGALELNAGFISGNNIKIGDNIEWLD